MNVAEKLAELLALRAQREAIEAREKDMRAELSGEALVRWEADGAAPSWKVPGLGSATLAGTDSTETLVADEVAFKQWAVENHPESVAVVIRLPADNPDDTAEEEPVQQRLAAVEFLLQSAEELGARITSEVEPGLLYGLVSHGVANDGRLFTEAGQVAGVIVRAKDPYLSVRLSAEAKARARAALTPPPPDDPSWRCGACGQGIDGESAVKMGDAGVFHEACCPVRIDAEAATVDAALETVRDYVGGA